MWIICEDEPFCTISSPIEKFTGGLSIRVNWSKLTEAAGENAECRINGQIMKTAIQNTIRVMPFINH